MDKKLKELWCTFERGDHLETWELKRLKKSAEEGLAYLRARGESLAAAKTLMDLNRITDYLHARKQEWIF